MAGGYQVSPAMLEQAAKGINDTMAALKDVTNVEEAESGHGFTDLALTQKEAGSAALMAAFSDFCERWSWGVRNLVQDANQIAMNLGLSAGNYNDMEQYGVGVLKDAANAVNVFSGDPHASQETIEGESFGDAASAASRPGESFDQLGTDTANTWKGVARDYLTNGIVGTAVKATGHGQGAADLANDLLGPPPEQPSGS